MKGVRDIRMPKIGRWVRFTKNGESITGQVTRHDSDMAYLSTGHVFNYNAGDRLEWYGSTQPKARLPNAQPKERPVLKSLRLTRWARAVLTYAVLASTIALALAAYPLLK